MKTLSPNKQIVFSFIAYIVLLVASLIAANMVTSTIWKAAILLIPLVPGFLIVLSMVAAIRSMDEMQRRIQLEALGFAFAAMFMLLLTEALLGALVPQELLGPGMYILYMAFMWSVGLMVAQRRYK